MDMGNEEEPQINKNDGGSIPPGPSRSLDPSRAATSSHEKPRDQDDRLAPAPTRRRGPTGRSSKSTATASSPSTSSSARPALTSRHSTTSSEPMDPTAYGGHAQGSSSGGGSMTPSAMPTRPMGNMPGDGSMPVKLTPITGRVSRAKKGVPVHTCDICKPPKTFTRAEHLRRHQLSHKTPGFPCIFPGCEKAFHRADLLARHAQRHDHDDKASSGGMSRPPSAGTLDDPSSGLSYMTHSHSSMGRDSGSRSGMPGPSDSSSGTSYPGGMQYQMGGQGSTSGGTSMSPSHHPGRGDSYQNSPNPGQSYVLSGLINPPPSIGGSPVTGTDHFFGLEYQPRTSSPFPSMFMDTAILPQNLPSLTIPDNSIPPGLVHAGHDGSPWPSSASESTYSTPSEIGHRRHNMNTQGYESPTSDWPLYSHNMQSPGGGLEVATTTAFFGTAFSSTASNIDQTMNLPVPFSDEQSFVDQQYHPYSSVRSPTPPTISLSAQSNENLVTLAAPSIPDAASAGTRQKGSTMLLGTFQGAAFLTANTLPPHVRNAIPKYLQAYWKSFDTLFPVVHRKSVKTAADEVLRCAMAAVGAQYLQGKDDRIRANELHEFAWKEVKTCTKWNLQIMQTIILCEFYARFRGRSVLRYPSESFQSLYSRVSSQSSSPSTFVGSLIHSAPQGHLFSFVLSSPNGPWYPYSTFSSSQMANHQIPDNFLFSTSTRNERWNEWIDNESRRRLFAVCFVLDAHASVYYQQHVIQQFPMSTRPIPLIRPTEDLWAAQSPEVWEALLDTRPADMGPLSHTGETPTAEQVLNARYLDRAVFLTSEALCLPKRSNPSMLDLSVEVDLTSTERISRLFPGSAVGNTYLALHYTPLHDLLAVSGDTWLFSRKVASPQVFQQHKKRLQLWCGSPHASAAVGFAAKALLAFLDGSESRNHNTLNTDPEEQGDLNNNWNMLDISDYWAVYACALICWALGHRSIGRNAYSGSGSDCTSPHHDHDNANAGEREAMRWLKMVAAGDSALGARNRRESMGVISMVRRRLEDEAVGAKSRLLVDAVGTLKKIEERAGSKWF
ncbi:hypothetical protein F4813DRAFT_384294 [Daldinia decipiens]|uniref:uncharacterized protein n=1 Tax=Daldinia decipiens TaxID=326647 RepID=UPI0020C36897|nr:uncharacterized protein F4813DRAFT_384294 [Daldinia decipiens]KAI1662713.1 hypothetical protein F4813DRAFT_384294 [Daldinia decipiens]